MIRRLLSWVLRRPKGGWTGASLGEPTDPHMENSGIMYRGLNLCPACIWVFDPDDPETIVEVIDCRTNKHQTL